jgi:hypothetical protein
MKRRISLSRYLRSGSIAVIAVLCLIAGITPALAQMDLRQASGVPLPAADLPVGSVSVRVVRGSFANNLSGVDVTFTVDGKTTVMKTDDGGRVQINGLTPGAHVKAEATVGAEHLLSQDVTIAGSGIRFVLVASGDAPPTAGPAVQGRVTLGPNSRIVADFTDDRLDIYYAVQILNATSSPVDIGQPFDITLPSAARGATIMDGSSPQAVISSGHVVVTGPFAPGATTVNIAYSLPYDGAVAHLEQRWPVDAAAFGVFALKTGDLDLSSPQLTTKQTGVQQGQALVMGLLPALPAGQTVTLDITGLPHHAAWPRNVALGMAGTIMAIGLWAAFAPGSRRRAA